MNREQQEAFLPDQDSTCATCADEAEQVKITKIIDASNAIGLLNGMEIEIDISLVEDVLQGDKVLVHAGVALSYFDG